MIIYIIVQNIIIINKLSVCQLQNLSNKSKLRFYSTFPHSSFHCYNNKQHYHENTSKQEHRADTLFFALARVSRYLKLLSSFGNILLRIIHMLCNLLLFFCLVLHLDIQILGYTVNIQEESFHSVQLLLSIYQKIFHLVHFCFLSCSQHH